MQFLLIISLVIAIIAVIFAVQNPDPTTISFLTWEGDIPLAVVLIVTLGAGVLIGMLTSSPSIVRNKLKVRNQNKQIKDIESKLEEQNAKLEEAQKELQELEAKPEETAPEGEVEQAEILPAHEDIAAEAVPDSEENLPEEPQVQ
jgi:uncharacterized integral membrane protein